MPATTCAHNDKTVPARVWTQLVINGYMVCPVTVKRVTPFSASEAVARDVKNGAIPSTLPPLLARVGSKHGGLVGQPRHSVYWVLIDMPLLVSGGPAGSCGAVAPLKGFSFDLVNADTGKWVWSAQWSNQGVNLTPAPQHRAAWRHRVRHRSNWPKPWQLVVESTGEADTQERADCRQRGFLAAPSAGGRGLSGGPAG